jgi:lysozyme family protein
MATFSQAWSLTDLHEGGYQDNYLDTGNFCSGYDSGFDIVGTNHGITCNTYFAYYGFYATKESMKLLTSSDAGKIAEYLYWDKYNLASIPIQGIANQVFDFLFHFSYRTASDLIQMAILQAGGHLPEYGNDKQFGSETLFAIIQLCNLGKADLLNQKLIDVRTDYYNNRVISIPSQAVFIDGWINRADSYTMSFIKGSAITVTLLALGTFWYLSNRK